VLDTLQLAAGAESANRIDHRVELSEKKGAQVIFLAQQAFGASLRANSSRGRRYLLQGGTEISKQCPTLELFDGNLRHNLNKTWSKNSTSTKTTKIPPCRPTPDK
jgi:hypothetical protein